MEERYRTIRRPSFAKLAGSAPVKPGLSVRSLTHGVSRNGRSNAQGFRDKGGPNEHVGDPLRTAQIAELGAAAAQAISAQVDLALVVDAVRGAPPRIRAVRRAPLGGWVALEHHAIGGGCNAQDAETADLHCGRRMRSWGSEHGTKQRAAPDSDAHVGAAVGTPVGTHVPPGASANSSSSKPEKVT